MFNKKISRIKKNDATKNWTDEVLDDVLREEIRLVEDGRVEVKWDKSIYNLEEMWNDNNSLIYEAPFITMPVLIIVRKNHPQLGTTINRLISTLPTSELRTVDKIGHSMYMEDPDMIAKMAKEWFEY